MFWACLWPFGPFLEHFGPIFACFGHIGLFWHVLSLFVGILSPLGPNLGHFGPILSVLGLFCGLLSLTEPFFDILGLF